MVTTLSDNSDGIGLPESDRSQLGGAYGLRIDVPDGFIDRTSLVDPPASWPAWSLDWKPLDDGLDRDVAVVESWSPDHSVLAAQPSGYISVDRVDSRTTLHLDDVPSPATLLHPYLASTAVVAGHWMGRSPFHAGVFAVGDVRAGSVKRVASSVGEGSVVISKVWEFVNR